MKGLQKTFLVVRVESSRLLPQHFHYNNLYNIYSMLFLDGPLFLNHHLTLPVHFQLMPTVVATVGVDRSKTDRKQEIVIYNMFAFQCQYSCIYRVATYSDAT